MCYDNNLYIIKSSKDDSLSARDEYSGIMGRLFDLVLVQNGYPLEPNYVIIESVPSHFIELDVKVLNL